MLEIRRLREGPLRKIANGRVIVDEPLSRGSVESRLRGWT
jgi:hypothetical protein